jgi:hypothetical protein
MDPFPSRPNKMTKIVGEQLWRRTARSENKQGTVLESKCTTKKKSILVAEGQKVPAYWLANPD